MSAHDALWKAAMAKRDVLTGRLRIALLVLAALGVGVTSQLINKLKSVGDESTVKILHIIM